MKIKCNCGTEFEWELFSFPQGHEEHLRKPCPNCRRSYELTVRLLPENEKFWKV